MQIMPPILRKRLLRMQLNKILQCVCCLGTAQHNHGRGVPRMLSSVSPDSFSMSASSLHRHGALLSKEMSRSACHM